MNWSCLIFALISSLYTDSLAFYGLSIGIGISISISVR